MSRQQARASQRSIPSQHVKFPSSPPYLTYEYAPDGYEPDEYAPGGYEQPMTEKEALRHFARQMPDMPPSDIYDAWLSMKIQQQNQQIYYPESQQAYRGIETGRRPQSARWEAMPQPQPQPQPYPRMNQSLPKGVPKGGGGKDLIDSRGRWVDRPRGPDHPPGPPGYYYSPQLKNTSSVPGPEPRYTTQGKIRSQEMREGPSTHPVGEVVSYLDVSPRTTREFHGVASHQISTSKQPQSRTKEQQHSASFDPNFDPNVSHLSTRSGGYYDYGHVHPHDHPYDRSHQVDSHTRVDYDHAPPPHMVGGRHPFDSGRPTKSRSTFHDDYERKMQQRVRVKAAQQGHYTATKEAYAVPQRAQRPQTAAPVSRSSRYPQSFNTSPSYSPQREYAGQDGHYYQYEPAYEPEEDARPQLSSYARDAFYSKHEDPSLIGHPQNIVPSRASLVEPATQSDAATDAGSQLRRALVIEQEARKSMNAKDLDRAKSTIGSHAVPGSPNVRLIGGQWKSVVQENEGKPLWTDFYGPTGGGKEKVSYYGRMWKQEDKRVM